MQQLAQTANALQRHLLILLYRDCMIAFCQSVFNKDYVCMLETGLQSDS